MEIGISALSLSLPVSPEKINIVRIRQLYGPVHDPRVQICRAADLSQNLQIFQALLKIQAALVQNVSALFQIFRYITLNKIFDRRILIGNRHQSLLNPAVILGADDGFFQFHNNAAELFPLQFPVILRQKSVIAFLHQRQFHRMGKKRKNQKYLSGLRGQIVINTAPEFFRISQVFSELTHTCFRLHIRCHGPKEI